MDRIYVYTFLCMLIVVLNLINLNLVKYIKTLEKGLNNITIAIESQNNILNYNPGEIKE